MQRTRTATIMEASITASSCTSSVIRRYEAADHPRVVDICRNVYGGTDVLPRLIQKDLANNPTATILVAQPADGQRVDGVVCGEERASSLYLFGLRVGEEARGNGVATKLMEHLCQQGCAQPHIQHLLSTTIPQNQPAVRIFTNLGFTHSRTVDRWPQQAVQLAYEAAVGFTPNEAAPEQPVVFEDQQLNMMDFIPGARELLTQATGGLGVQSSDWVRCQCMQQLQQAVTSIRQHQQDQHPPVIQQALQRAPLDWLPWVYEVFPMQSSWVQDRVTAGDVWLLPQAALDDCQTGPSTSYHSVVVLTHSHTNYRTTAGVIAAGEAHIAAAFDFIASKVPHFVAYVDSGSRHSSGRPDPELLLPKVLMLGRQEDEQQQYMCFVVLSRTADGALAAKDVALPSKM